MKNTEGDTPIYCAVHDAYETSGCVETSYGTVYESREGTMKNTAAAGFKAFETSSGEVYDAEAWTIRPWEFLGLIVTSEHERLAFPWAAITKIELEEP